MTTKSTVKRTPLSIHKAAASVQTLQAVVNAGTSNTAVQGSPLAKQALTSLQAVLATASTTVSTKANNLNALTASRKALVTNFTDLEAQTRTYESAINVLADGDPAAITAAGLLARNQKTPAAALGAMVKDVRSTLGKAVKEAVLHWPAVAGATTYALQVNWTPATPTAAYTALPFGSSRRRVILAPTQGAQFLVQIAAVSSDGTQSAWSDPYLATARWRGLTARPGPPASPARPGRAPPTTFEIRGDRSWDGTGHQTTTDTTTRRWSITWPGCRASARPGPRPSTCRPRRSPGPPSPISRNRSPRSREGLAHAEACAKRLAETDARDRSQAAPPRRPSGPLGQGTHSPLN